MSDRMDQLEMRVAELERRLGPPMTAARYAEIRAEVAAGWGRTDNFAALMSSGQLYDWPGAEAVNTRLQATLASQRAPRSSFQDVLRRGFDAVAGLLRRRP